jgi:hypothetical protein
MPLDLATMLPVLSTDTMISTYMIECHAWAQVTSVILTQMGPLQLWISVQHLSTVCTVLRSRPTWVPVGVAGSAARGLTAQAFSAVCIKTALA